jgi:hypothetical protein
MVLFELPEGAAPSTPQERRKAVKLLSEKIGSDVHVLAVIQPPYNDVLAELNSAFQYHRDAVQAVRSDVETGAAVDLSGVLDLIMQDVMILHAHCIAALLYERAPKRS